MFSSLLPSEKQWISDWWLWAEAIGTKSLRCVAVNATGRRVKLLSGLSGKCTSHALTMTIHPEAPDCACLSCLGWNQDPQLCSFFGIRKLQPFGSMQLGAVRKCWATCRKNAPGTFLRWRFTPKPQLQPPVRFEWISQHVLFLAATEKQWISDWWL